MQFVKVGEPDRKQNQNNTLGVLECSFSLRVHLLTFPDGVAGGHLAFLTESSSASNFKVTVDQISQTSVHLMEYIPEIPLLKCKTKI